MNTEKLQLTHPGGIIKGTVQLTGSKSESNRALILSALTNGKVRINNLSNADDTITLSKAIKVAKDKKDPVTTIDIGPAGTAMRFLTAYLSFVDGEFILTGSDRMKQRPLGVLVDALRTIGATIQYVEQEGYPPLQISGNILQTEEQVNIKGDVSSQYLSALLLIAPFLPHGLSIHITSDLTSRPYVEMTLSMLEETGIKYKWHKNIIAIEPQKVMESVLTIEPDWSAASYWYTIIALSPIDSSIFLPHLKKNSLQGDSAIQEIMTNFGVVSTFDQNGLKIEKTATPNERLNIFDFKECPDLAQTVIVCCAALGYNASFTGLETLKIKETDRIKALQNELAKFRVTLLEEGNVYHLNTDDKIAPQNIVIDTYEDHRMAMAFAPLAMVFDKLTVNDPAVVGKSYPAFWEHLKQIGFTVDS
ncbi:3-phosphoshikimate 1-carboxyvinyltransferase [Olivibacter sp. SDN3]|uniref:3-phosphoshikimate 1-carboxyvinyltransferase n=1 Tax=Olivibacter sp. SDN3 TaxID=2764720 RepID=UPI001650FDE1|nr:3-phosphoshikimate 1-carboxyvinyltransferase [Olivibacter sp. SDN3]QNL48490.1 3-phosphoshikimate 1-carboxyvinyltransferase [Olivibacter sp. SDN3]